MILLDTQVVLWSVRDDSRLSRNARARMQRDGCYVSAISIVEFRIKQMTGKLALPPDLPAHIGAQGFRPLAYEAAHAEGLARFPQLARHDPFDRMLVAQAKIEGLDFLTSDRALLELDETWIHDATT